MDESLSFWDRHRLSLLLIITVAIAIVLTSVSVTIYNISGAAQLDLSRPGYLSVSSKAEKTDNINGYNATGTVNKQTIEDFLKQYDEQIQKAKSVDAFSGDPLNPDVLEFSAPAAE